MRDARLPRSLCSTRRTHGKAISIWLLAVSVGLAAADRGAAQECIGDCNGNGHVEINELVIGVNVALGLSLADTCSSLGANPSIDRLVTAVDYSISGCPGGPTRTPTPTTVITPTETPTTGPTAGRCGNGVVEFPPIVPVGETCDPEDGPAAEERPEQPGDTCPADCMISECNENTPLEVDVHLSAPAEAFLAILDVWVRYPDGDVGIRGRAAGVLNQLTNLPPDAAVTPNDVDFALRALFTDTAEVGLPLDRLFTIRFQLCASPPPAADAFRCEVVTATDYNVGGVTSQTTCTVVVSPGS